MLSAHKTLQEITSEWSNTFVDANASTSIHIFRQGIYSKNNVICPRHNYTLPVMHTSQYCISLNKD